MAELPVNRIMLLPAFVTALFCLLTVATAAGKSPASILSAPPRKPDVNASHLFYLHGRIVQEQGRNAVSPKYGRYEYNAILRRFAAAGFVVISEVRPRAMGASVYADRVAAQIKRLLDAGVPARRIAVVGGSMGGSIALLVSSRVTDRSIGYAILGICSNDILELGDDLHGDLLSIFEASDEQGGSCALLFGRAKGLLRHAEIRIDTGLQHGFLYRPLSAWMDPVIRWVRERGATTTDSSLATAPFVAMARTTPCADTTNRLFVIDNALVFWHRVGNCMDNGYGSQLFGKTVDDLLCHLGDSIAGPRKSCPAQEFGDMFEILINHIDQPDLGLGPGHSVQPIPLAGTVPSTTRGSRRS